MFAIAHVAWPPAAERRANAAIDRIAQLFDLAFIRSMNESS
jgi:hypothetical protein